MLTIRRARGRGGGTRCRRGDVRGLVGPRPGSEHASSDSCMRWRRVRFVRQSARRRPAASCSATPRMSSGKPFGPKPFPEPLLSFEVSRCVPKPKESRVDWRRAGNRHSTQPLRPFETFVLTTARRVTGSVVRFARTSRRRRSNSIGRVEAARRWRSNDGLIASSVGSSR
jgi:hypothetical protein